MMDDMDGMDDMNDSAKCEVRSARDEEPAVGEAGVKGEVGGWKPKACFLRGSQVRLMDGRDYVFRALPWTPKVMALMDEAGAEKVPARRLAAITQELAEMSLRWDYEPSVVEELVASGALPLLPRGEEASAVWQAVWAAFSATG